MATVQVVRQALDPHESAAVERLRTACPGYSVAGQALPEHLRFDRTTKRRPGPRLRFAADLGGRADTGRYHDRLARYAEDCSEPLVPGSTLYFRATYARRSLGLLPGADSVLESAGLAGLAARCHPAEIVHPFILYANVYLPGQVLDVHTDVPAFRGADLENVAPWLLVAMRHSGRFEHWRLPVATVIVYPDTCRGGSLTYDDGDAATGRRAVTVAPETNTAVAFDADTVFHQVDAVAGQTSALREISKGAYLAPSADFWTLWRHDAGTGIPLARFRPHELRYSVSWKAYCFADGEAHRRWCDHTDDLDIGAIVPTLVDELCRRSVLPGPDHGLSETELATALIDELVRFPPPGWADPEQRPVTSAASRSA